MLYHQKLLSCPKLGAVYNMLPDKDTTSVMFRPTSTNFLMIASSVSNGEGSEAFANAPFEISPSLLPNKTLHVGPPLCQKFRIGIHP